MAEREFLPIDQAEKPFFAGIDLGGTNIKAGIVDDRGRALGYATMATEIEKGPEDGARRMAETARRAAESAGLPMDEIAYVGLATPGTMDIPKGLLLHPVNLPGWENFPVRDRVSHHAGRPVMYANDANAAAYGEYWIGSGSQYGSMIMLTLGTGVGGGIIVGDQTIDGENSHGSECGHIIIDSRPDARTCSCDRRGHLEAYASATAVAQRAEEALDAGRESLLAKSRAAGEEVTSFAVFQASDQGDALALELIVETARYLGVGITRLLHTIDPAAVVLGGAMDFGGPSHKIGQQFLAEIKNEVHRHSFPVIA